MYLKLLRNRMISQSAIYDNQIIESTEKLATFFNMNGKEGGTASFNICPKIQKVFQFPKNAHIQS